MANIINANATVGEIITAIKSQLDSMKTALEGDSELLDGVRGAELAKENIDYLITFLQTDILDFYFGE